VDGRGDALLTVHPPPLHDGDAPEGGSIARGQNAMPCNVEGKASERTGLVAVGVLTDVAARRGSDVTARASNWNLESRGSARGAGVIPSW
jgi:hypothetical protein